ncbi:SIR2 family protein [uncultured Chryseobacterium sp.]|uniref:SIR2 family protein n=1 Tax=uncultured Chryseobacterium sp. TaxID=259322 RepID=UPI0025EDDB11|nr:SIR2 family protein [uncultured Chryseobacterium sp.]
MRIEIEEIFKQAINNDVNLFIGAGFSIGCKNIYGLDLPIGNELAIELAEKFSTPKLDLTKVTAIIESKSKDELNDYLRERFSVNEFDILYKSLDSIQIKSIYTTNIDNLVFKIFENSTNYYINDTTLQGPSFRDRKAINYYPLHGNVLNKERPMIFTSLAVASSFSGNPRLWSDLIRSIESTPTIFWGYSLSDPGILETLNSIKTAGYEKNSKWIVLHKENPEEEEYFKALGFNIIVANNEELLSYFSKNFIKKTAITSLTKTTKELLDEEFVPSNPNLVPVREINEFYLGAAPSWSDIYRPDLYKTSHFRIIQNSIFSKKDTIIIGIPGSGKTTLIMQLAAFTNFDGHKIILEFPTVERAKNIINSLNGEKAIVFIDNFTEEAQSFLEFHKCDNITLVGADREHNFEIISHLIDKKQFDIISVTTLTKTDIQEIFARIPQIIKSGILTSKVIKTDEDPSLFEFVNLNLKVPNINERYKLLMDKLDDDDELLSEFLLLACFVHYCRTPLSFDMAYSYFSDDINGYNEIYELRDSLGSLLVDNPITLIEDDNQDYFSSRSVILSEAIIENVKGKLLKRFLNRFNDNLPPYKIVNYRIFRKKGHDKFIAIRAFPNWEDGKAFYEKLMVNDPNNPFLLQQGALYLSYKQQHNEAFYWIDKARNMTRDSILSIRNSHAIILFDANIKKQGNEVKSTLDNSMNILINCYKQDKRKLYHAKKFAEQAIEYYERYGDEISKEYCSQAEAWIDEEIKTNNWHRGLRKTLSDLRQRNR